MSDAPSLIRVLACSCFIMESPRVGSIDFNLYTMHIARVFSPIGEKVGNGGVFEVTMMLRLNLDCNPPVDNH